MLLNDWLSSFSRSFLGNRKAFPRLLSLRRPSRIRRQPRPFAQPYLVSQELEPLENRLFLSAASVALSITVAEGDSFPSTIIVATVTASFPVSGDQSVDAAITSRFDEDFGYGRLLASATLTIPDGQRSATETIALVDDGAIALPGTAFMRLLNPSSGITLPFAQGMTPQLISLVTRSSPVPPALLDGAKGVVIEGAGKGVGIGDFNGDGFDDFAFSDPRANGFAGVVQVVFGQPETFGASISIDSLSASNGFAFAGTGTERTGTAVFGDADLNGDGLSDLLITTNSETSYIIYGRTDGIPSLLTSSDLAGDRGALLNTLGSRTPVFAGDVNGDGFEDIAFREASVDFENDTTAVVFGSADGFASSIDPATLDGTNGFRLTGGVHSGSPASAGDINGDGFDDLLIESSIYIGYSFTTGTDVRTQAAVVFGKSDGFAPSTDLFSLDGKNGFRITSLGAFFNANLSTAGDINGDGFNDILISGNFRDDQLGPGVYLTGGNASIIFGRSSGFTPTVTPDGFDGFRISPGTSGYFGVSTSGGGDINGDGLDDLLIGAPLENGADNIFGFYSDGTGRAVAIYGKRSGFTPHVSSFVDGTDGIVFLGPERGSNTGSNVSIIGDVNGDGFDDVLIDSPENIFGEPRESYLIYGQPFSAGAETQLGTSDADLLTANRGIARVDILVGGQGDDTLVSDGSGDVLLGGQGNDTLIMPDANFNDPRRIVGGSGVDELLINGTDVRLDLTRIGDTRIVDIEVIDIRGGSDNILILDVQEVLNISSTTNTLIVRRANENRVDIGTGWTQEAQQVIDFVTYDVYTQGAATLLVQARAVVKLSSLDGSNGFVINGSDPYDQFGGSVSNAGDFNGDGFDDVVIQTARGDFSADNDTGESYIVFGKSGGFTSEIELSTLDGTAGFRIEGLDAPSSFRSRTISGGGDINGDGFDDVIIGSPAQEVDGRIWTGQIHVLFGRSSGITPSVNVSSLGGVDGFRIDGLVPQENLGFSVAIAGDINADGIDDLTVGAFEIAMSGAEIGGVSYVLFGQTSGFDAVIDLSELDGTKGFRLESLARLGRSGDGAGDVNGDGIDDLILGASRKSGTEFSGGAVFVVFGKSTTFSSAIDLDSLDGSDGFRFNGTGMYDYLGLAVSDAGDVNGDGFDDFIFSATGRFTGRSRYAGESFVVFGRTDGFNSSIDLSSIDGKTGFRLDGLDRYGFSGASVSSAGDLNGDGFDDLIIGAPSSVKESYVVFGKSGGFDATLDFGSLDGLNGFLLDGSAGDDSVIRPGNSVSGGGDVNGDGFDDLIIGAFEASPNNRNLAGVSYVVFGRNFTGGLETQVGTDTADRLTAERGASAIDILIGGLGNDTLISDGGPDVLRGGEGNDVLSISDADFSTTRRITGGNGRDILRLDNAGITLDLTLIPNNRIVDVEAIDIRGNGDNVLTLDFREVINISSSSNTLLIRHDSGDTINIGEGWTRTSRRTIESIVYNVFTQGVAELLIEDIAPKVPQTFSLPNAGGEYVIVVSATGLALEVRQTQPTTRTLLSVPFDGLGDLTIIGSSNADTVTLGELDGYGQTITFNGNDGDDLFDASAASLATRVRGGAGKDTFVGGSGNDRFDGGAGADSASGGAGNDSLFGNGGNDTLTGDVGDDLLNGAAGLDLLTGGDGNDTILGGAGTDTLDGGSGADFVNGQGGQADIVAGGGGDDTLRGSPGDVIVPGSAGTVPATPTAPGDGSTLNVTLPATGGPFTVLINGTQLKVTSVSEAIVNVPLSGISDVSILGSSGDDSVILDASLAMLIGSVTFNGGAGNDSFDTSALSLLTLFAGGAGNDTLAGGSGRDIFNGGDGDDIASGGAGNDILNGDAGDDILVGDAGHDLLNGNRGMDSLFGGDGDDTLLGGGDTDLLDGGTGNDIANGQGGTGDIVAGGGGTDSLRGDSSDSLIDGPSGISPGNPQKISGTVVDGVLTVALPSHGGTFSIGVDGRLILDGQTVVGLESVVVVRDLNSIDPGTNRFEIVFFQSIEGITRIIINGGAADDVVTFDPRMSVFSDLILFNGGAGNDRLDASLILANVEFNGGAGDDTFIGGSGNDVVNGSAGNDSIFTGAGTDLIHAGIGNDSVDAGTDDDTVFGEDGDDVLIGGAGNDFLNGNGGSDTITGGDDDDTLLGGAGADSLDGGLGNDTVQGQGGTDIVIGGEGIDIVVS